MALKSCILYPWQLSHVIGSTTGGTPMAMSSADAKYTARALRDFFGISSKPINVTEDAVEGQDAPEREYLLRVVLVEKGTDGTAVKRAVMLESVQEAIDLTA